MVKTAEILAHEIEDVETEKDTLNALVETLRNWGLGRDLPSVHNQGICYNIDFLFPYVIDAWTRSVITSHMSKWPKAVGSMYPVPLGGLAGRQAYEINKRALWADTEYGNNRRELCLWLATEIEEAMKINERRSKPVTQPTMEEATV